MVKPVIKVMDMKLKFVRTSLKTIKDRTRRTEENVSKMVTRLERSSTLSPEFMS